MASETDITYVGPGKLRVRQVVMFKHGVAYYGLEGVVVDTDILKLTFKIGELDDVLKSLAAADLSGQGYISAVTYDATEDQAKLFESGAIRVPDQSSFSSTLEQLKGAEVELDIGSGTVSGVIVGLELQMKRLSTVNFSETCLVLFNRETLAIEKYGFGDIRGFKLQSEELGKELQFYLDAALLAKKRGSKVVSIACEGQGARNLAVSYVIESPTWKTSYRLLLPKEKSEENVDSEAPSTPGTILLSGWCLVENTTDQDWDHVELSLVAGMPVSFKMPLFRPIYMERPHVQPAKTTGAAVMDIEDEEVMEEFGEAELAAVGGKGGGMDYGAAKEKKAERPRAARAMAMAPSRPVEYRPAPAPPATTIDQNLYKDQVAKAAAVESKDFGELFEYKISKPVSIKRQQSALVPIVNANVDGRKILVFNPTKNKQNPMACVELMNTTGLTLERGPVTLLYEDTLAGEAMLPFLNQGETRVISYAVEQGVVILSEDHTTSHDIYKVTFANGSAAEHYYIDHDREYKINNKTEGTKTLLLDHPKTLGFDLVNEEPHKETADAWRFEFKLPPKEGVKFTTHERQEAYNSFSLWNVSADYLRDRITFYAKHEFVDAKVKAKLSKIQHLNEELRDIQAQISDHENTLRRIIDDQGRLRENLKALQKSDSELRLRETYITKLSEQEDEYEQIKAELKDMRAAAEKLNVRIRKLIEEFKM